MQWIVVPTTFYCILYIHFIIIIFVFTRPNYIKIQAIQRRHGMLKISIHYSRIWSMLGYYDSSSSSLENIHLKQNFLNGGFLGFAPSGWHIIGVVHPNFYTLKLSSFELLVVFGLIVHSPVVKINIVYTSET